MKKTALLSTVIALLLGGGMAPALAAAQPINMLAAENFYGDVAGRWAAPA